MTVNTGYLATIQISANFILGEEPAQVHGRHKSQTDQLHPEAGTNRGMAYPRRVSKLSLASFCVMIPSYL